MFKNRKLEIIVTAKDKASRILKKIGNSFSKWGKGSLKVASLVVAGLGAVTGALTVMFSKLASAIDEQAKIAASLGIANEALGVMRDAAGYAGISAGNLNTALRKMSQGIGDAANGTGEAKDALEELGLNAVKLQQMKPEDAFKAIVSELDKIPNGVRKTTLAMDLFGRSGAAMTNLTSKGLKQAQQDADDLGLKLSTSQAAGVEAANDAWSRIKNVSSDFLKYITAQLAPGVEKALGYAFSSLKDVDWAALGTKMAKGIGGGIVLILEGFEKLVTYTIDLRIGLTAIQLVFHKIQLKIWESLAAMRELNIAVREMTGVGSDDGLEKSKKILSEQRLIIGQIKRDLEADKKSGGSLLIDRETSKSAMDSFIKKIEDAGKAIGTEAKTAVKAEETKKTAINETTTAVQRQIEAVRQLNAERGKTGGTFSVASFANALEDEADK